MKGRPMNRFWDKPIEVAGINGTINQIRSAEEAAAFILDRWPAEMTAAMLKPLAKLIAVLDDGVCPEDARAEFLIAIQQIHRFHS